jgi:hypothetical protein
MPRVDVPYSPLRREAAIHWTLPSRGEARDARDAVAPPALPAERLREPWTPPRGRTLLAGVANLAVLVAILVVIGQEAPGTAPPGRAEPLVRPGGAARTVPAPPAPPWAEVAVAASPADLGPALGPAVAEELALVRDRISRCVALDRRRAAARSAARPSGATARGPAELVLRLAPRAGAVHVEGLEVRSPGASPEVLDCARRLLDGDVIPFAGAVPGRRQRLALSLE